MMSVGGNAVWELSYLYKDLGAEVEGYFGCNEKNSQTLGRDTTVLLSSIYFCSNVKDT